jgi:hypothetical protein
MQLLNNQSYPIIDGFNKTTRKNDFQPAKLYIVLPLKLGIEAPNSECDRQNDHQNFAFLWHLFLNPPVSRFRKLVAHPGKHLRTSTPSYLWRRIASDSKE